MGHSKTILKGGNSGKCTHQEPRDANMVTTHMTNDFPLRTSQAPSVQSRSYENDLIKIYIKKNYLRITYD